MVLRRFYITLNISNSLNLHASKPMLFQCEKNFENLTLQEILHVGIHDDQSFNGSCTGTYM